MFLDCVVCGCLLRLRDLDYFISPGLFGRMFEEPLAGVLLRLRAFVAICGRGIPPTPVCRHFLMEKKIVFVSRYLTNWSHGLVMIDRKTVGLFERGVALSRDRSLARQDIKKKNCKRHLWSWILKKKKNVCFIRFAIPCLKPGSLDRWSLARKKKNAKKEIVSDNCDHELKNTFAVSWLFWFLIMAKICRSPAGKYWLKMAARGRISNKRKIILFGIMLEEQPAGVLLRLRACVAACGRGTPPTLVCRTCLMEKNILFASRYRTRSSDVRFIAWSQNRWIVWNWVRLIAWSVVRKRKHEEGNFKRQLWPWFEKHVCCFVIVLIFNHGQNMSASSGKHWLEMAARGRIWTKRKMKLSGLMFEEPPASVLLRLRACVAACGRGTPSTPVCRTSLMEKEIVFASRCRTIPSDVRFIGWSQNRWTAWSRDRLIVWSVARKR